MRFALRQYGHGRRSFSFALDYEALGGIDADDGSVQLRRSLTALRFQLIRIHAGEYLSGCDEITLVHQYFADSSGDLGRDVDLSRFDAAISAGDPRWETASPKSLLGIVAAPGNDHDEGGNKPVLPIHCH